MNCRGKELLGFNWDSEFFRWLELAQKALQDAHWPEADVECGRSDRVCIFLHVILNPVSYA